MKRTRREQVKYILIGILLGMCICYQNFVGDDCSIGILQPPVVTWGIQLCDLDSDDDGCSTVIITGTTFVNTDLLTCHMTAVVVGKQIN